MENKQKITVYICYCCGDDYDVLSACKKCDWATGKCLDCHEGE